MVKQGRLYIPQELEAQLIVSGLLYLYERHSLQFIDA